jgi:hypothetical protein
VRKQAPSPPTAVPSFGFDENTGRHAREAHRATRLDRLLH